MAFQNIFEVADGPKYRVNQSEVIEKRVGLSVSLQQLDSMHFS
ncbi:hypothetical protein GARC_0674 [Paraglaciecola arctica BSs20135]|uniref:Uncharacterized protein n=1 Tax=Paraglaciecola arctica BSs20135 TaxID=493475 RepID=K6Z2G8_9ALTE|nr:hypothetical protein GARC_0674 [Paraglaciecola arctica BSs20135]